MYVTSVQQSNVIIGCSHRCCYLVFYTVQSFLSMLVYVAGGGWGGGGGLFFQAEDGIRDLVRSRGLGDVYKRQAQRRLQFHGLLPDGRFFAVRAAGSLYPFGAAQGLLSVPDVAGSVSYTHLTLPTSDLG